MVKLPCLDCGKMHEQTAPCSIKEPPMPGIDDPKDPTSQITGSCPCPALPEGMVVVRVDYLNAALALWREQRGIKGDCNCPGCREVRSYFKIILEGK